MSTESTQLLKMLGSGVRPTSGVAGLGAGKSSNIDSAPFAELLKQAENGELSSQRRVTVDKSAGVQLNEAQSIAISAAADRAEAAGIRKALVMLDDQAFVLDVGSRTITGKADFNKGIMTGIDGVLKISSSTNPADGPRGNANSILPLPKASPSQLLNRPSKNDD